MNKWPLFCGMVWGPNLKNALGGDPIGHRGCWFRVLGWGLHISTRKREDAYFSERYGFRGALYVLGWRFEVLRRSA